MQVTTGLLAALALLHTATGTRPAPLKTADGRSRTLCAIASNAASGSAGQPCTFDFFATTALSDEGGWFTATCAENQVRRDMCAKRPTPLF
jgi:hypothetical protein